LRKAYIEKDISGPPSEGALRQDSHVLVVAGSETTATILTTILFYLAKHPAVLFKLKRYLDLLGRSDAGRPGGLEIWESQTITSIDDIKNAKQFIPERWTEKRMEISTDGAPFFSFLLGIIQSTPISKSPLC